jgi:hypothetical protein
MGMIQCGVRQRVTAVQGGPTAGPMAEETTRQK